MRIENLFLEPSGSGRTVLAAFDVEISPDIILRNWVLRRNRDGQVRCHPPVMRDRCRPLTLSPRLYGQVNLAANEAYRDATTGSLLAHDSNNAA